MCSSNLPAVLNHVDASGPRSQVPEPDRFVLRAWRKNGSSPSAEREHVASVTRVGLPYRESGRIGAIRYVDPAIARAARD